MTHRVAYLPGDGIGPEVLAAARTVVAAAGLDVEWVEGRIGWQEWTRHGDALPAETLQILDDTDACLFGAIESLPPAEAEAALPPALRDGRVYRSPILRIRHEKGLHVNVRPNRFWPGIRSPLDDPPIGQTITIFRENTEDLYVGVEAHPVSPGLADALATHLPGYARFQTTTPHDIALSTRINTTAATERLIEAAFRHAAAHGHTQIVLAEKANVLRATGSLVLKSAERVAAHHPAIALQVTNVDALAADLVLHPERHPVVAATNLFGDILSDLAAALTGGLGVAPSANLGTDYALFEPVHGSAPDIAGTGTANPIAAVLSAALLADWLGATQVHDRILHAVANCLLEDEALTPDLGGSGSTRELTQALVAHVETTGPTARVR